MLVNLKDILEIASNQGIAVGSFNVTGLDSLCAIIESAEELNVPVIISHAEVHNCFNDIEIIAPCMLNMAKKAKVPVCVHLDHGVSLEMIYKAVRFGFTSIMIDMSRLPFDNNLELTKSVSQICKPLNISIEAELGQLITFENDNNHLDERQAEYCYTNPQEAKIFVEKTNIDALAIAFGTSHGFYKSPYVLSFDTIINCKKATGIPLVMHGGSGLSSEDYQKAIKSGISKINYYSYMSKAGFLASKKVIESNSTSYYHDICFAARQAMKEDVKKAMKIFSFKQ